MKTTLAGPEARLSMAEAHQVRSHQDRLLAALRARDRQAVRSAQQAVLQGAYRGTASPALRRALRELAWLAAGYVASHQMRWHGRQRI